MVLTRPKENEFKFLCGHISFFLPKSSCYQNDMLNARWTLVPETYTYLDTESHAN